MHDKLIPHPVASITAIFLFIMIHLQICRFSLSLKAHHFTNQKNSLILCLTLVFLPIS
uniref:Uncharacterized protein n=1 Tax=Octopus bimaculoides TaxID=37653 RepID=A0A0L8HM79_OCTBM